MSGARGIRTRLSLLLGLALLPLTVMADAPALPASKAQRIGQVQFEPCILQAPSGLEQRARALCGSLKVPENPQLPQGRQIELKLAWVPPLKSFMAQKDPVFLLSGGPGQDTLQTYAALAPSLAEIRQRRGMVLVDQRGTGGSNRLDCPMAPGTDMLSMPPQALVAFTQACQKALADKADLRFYTTTDAVRDLEAVRKALGLERINLLGISYGTRVALQYARQYPQQTRALILDSPLPNGHYLGELDARQHEDALKRLLSRCTEDTACRKALGDPYPQLLKALEKLRAKPVEVNLKLPPRGEWVRQRLTDETMASLVRLLAYSPETASMLPLLIHQAAQGHYEVPGYLARQMNEQLREILAMGMYTAVACTEDIDSFQKPAGQPDPLMLNANIRAMAQACRSWPRGEVPAGFDKQISPDIPVLALTGEFDPTLGHAMGEAAVAGLKNARHLHLKHQAHNVMSAGCMPELMADFLRRPDAAALDVSCLDELKPVPLLLQWPQPSR